MRHVLSSFTRATTLTALIGCSLISGQAQAPTDFDAKSWAGSPYMLGDWGGVRTKLENLGVTFNFISVNDLLVDTRSDLANWSRVRGTVDVDFGKADLVQGLTFHMTALWQAGGNMGTYIGSVANPSSLVSADTIRLDSWWFEKALASDKLFLRAGQFAGLDFYGDQQYGSSYIMEPLGYASGICSPRTMKASILPARLPPKSGTCPQALLFEVGDLLGQPEPLPRRH